MRKDLLERGVALLREDANNPHGVKFNLGTWASPDQSSMADRIKDQNIVNLDVDGIRWMKGAKVPVSCGTQACAMGLFAISSAFADEGLSYTIDEEGNLYPSIHVDCVKQEGFEAAEVLFEISHDDARYLFDPDCYKRTPTGKEGEEAVADRIAAFANGVIDPDFYPANDEDD